MLIAAVVGVVAAAASDVAAQQQVAAAPVETDWPYFGGTTAFTRYAPLDQIDRRNVTTLRILWRRPAIDPVFTQAFSDLTPSNYLRSTPIMVEGILYASNAVGLVEAFDPGTGETIWMQRPLTPTLAGVAGRAAYGVAFWADGPDRRIFSLRNTHLYALDADTGSELVVGQLLKPSDLGLSIGGGVISDDDVIIIVENAPGGGKRLVVTSKTGDPFLPADIVPGNFSHQNLLVNSFVPVQRHQ